ncbi:MAG: HD family phosphohydrolase [Phycisphaerae bacterium]
MWFEKKSLRRIAVAEETAPRQQFWKNIIARQWGFIAIATLCMLILLVVELIPNSKPVWLGTRAPATILSPVTFSLPDHAEFAALQAQARLDTNPVLKLNNKGKLLEIIGTELNSLPYDVAAIKTPADLPEPLRTRFPSLSANALKYLHSIVVDNEFPQYSRRITLLISELKRRPVINEKTLEAIARTPSVNIVVRTVNGSRIEQRRIKLNELGVLNSRGRGFRPMVERCLPEPLWNTVAAFLAAKKTPTFILDPSAMAKLAAANQAAITMPLQVFHRGEVLIHYGEVITPATREILHSAYNAWRRRLVRQHPWALWQHILGLYVITGVLGLLGAIYLGYRLREGKFRRPLAPAIFLLGSVVAAKVTLAAGLATWMYLLGITPILLAAMILVMAYDQRFAMGMSALNSLLVTVATGQNLAFFLTAFVTSAIVIFSLYEIRTRTQLIRVGLVSALLAGATVLGFGFSRTPLTHAVPLDWLYAAPQPGTAVLLDQAMLAAGAVFLAIFIMLGLLPIVERIFGITTAMTLLELSDTNQPLLRRLAMEAPGTFSHSLVLGSMAEAAARALGADSLLCRVGAYYHDIGKLLKPGYFMENMNAGQNRHEKLSPAMSLLIVVGHVKDGLELAREYHLPLAVRDFIAAHHGTTIVEFFFHAARERQARETLTGGLTAPVEETDFRYPGPKPHSKETAILMICDGSEGIIRSMPDPTAAKIEGAVHQLIMKRLLDGQFEQCPLTLSELAVIEQSLVRTLVGAYHGRMPYPKAIPISRPA